MGWVLNNTQYLSDDTRVRFGASEGLVKPRQYAGVPHGYISVLFEGLASCALIPYGALEVFVPDPPVKQYRETSYYRDTQTGTLYYVSGSDAISITHISASIYTSAIMANPARYKRLFMEV